jgi:hypothetical protein
MSLFGGPGGVQPISGPGGRRALAHHKEQPARKLEERGTCANSRLWIATQSLWITVTNLMRPSRCTFARLHHDLTGFARAREPENVRLPARQRDESD